MKPRNTFSPGPNTTAAERMGQGSSVSFPKGNENKSLHPRLSPYHVACQAPRAKQSDR